MAWHPFRNFGLKALAVALATLMWMTVTHDQVAERSLRVPLEFQNIPGTLEITGDPPGSVDVRVRGPSGTLARLDPGEVVAVVDLRSARPGQRLFHLMTQEVRVPFGIEVAQVSPATIAVNFEPSGTRVVPVVPAVEGTPAGGYVRGRVTVVPDTVEVVGPESRLGKLTQATTESVSIDNASRTVQDTVTVGVADAALRLRSPKGVQVRVEILPAPIERAIPGVPVRVRNLGRGRRATVQPATVMVTVRGAQEALGSLRGEQLEVWVDASSLGPGRYALPLKTEATDDYGVVAVQPATVRVSVR